MGERVSIVTGFYGELDEDARLNRSRHGQLEYFTTMEYIHRYAKKARKSWKLVQAQEDIR